ncbi:hypothetical protein [Caldifermentibacillus hisashii]|uniref:hypothetical protein n=1 Tax=Caldifermentibacillus hisashii TaxID=996558 RepID=UPI0030E82551
MATRPVLVVIFGQDTSFFSDENISRRRFEVRNSFFWRRDPISQSYKENSAIAEPLGESRAVVHRKNIKFFGLRCIPVKFSLCTYT